MMIEQHGCTPPCGICRVIDRPFIKTYAELEKEVDQLHKIIVEYYQKSLDHAGNIQLANQDITRLPYNNAWQALAAVAELLVE